MPRLANVRWRMEIQGFAGLDDRTLERLEPWTRFTPAATAAWAAVATLSESSLALAGLAAIAAIGGVRGTHPLDLTYNTLFSPIVGAPAIPRAATPRRFAFVIAAVWLGVAAFGFAIGARSFGRTIGATFTVAALVPSLTGVCLASWLYARVTRA